MMSQRIWGPFCFAAALFVPQGAPADHDDGRYSGSMPTANVPGAVSGGYWRRYSRPYYETIGPDGVPIFYVPPMPGPVPLILVPRNVPGGGRMPLAGPLPPGGMRRGGLAPVRPPLALPKKKGDPAKAAHLSTFGDRMFRAGNTRRAAERYEQAARADPYSAGPRVRLAQVALVRGQYTEAADLFRAAENAEPGWLAKPFDVQSIYAEPGDFAKQIAKLESHLQGAPGDRDAWLVLGAQWYLSGRTRRAGDVFVRLSDRKPDAALAAFLDASRPADAEQE